MKTEFYLSRESSGGRLDRAAYRPWPLRWIPTLVPAAAISMLLGSVPLNAIGNALSESATGVIVRSPLPGAAPPFDERFLTWMDHPRKKHALPGMRESIRAQLEYLTTTGRNELQQQFTRAEPHLSYMKLIFREEGLPEDLVYLALIESGFDLTAVSEANAVGPWQFTLPTARSYGLRIDRWIDERRDLLKSTNAAARYLKDLYGRFGSWPLALASYNTGPTRVRQAMRNTNSSDFWHLKALRQIHRETQNYVPKFIAYAVIAGNKDAFGFTRKAPAPLDHEEVLVGRSTDLRLLALSAGSSYEWIKGLNPELRGRRTPPYQKAYRVRLPNGSGKILPAVLAPLADDRQVRGTQPYPGGRNIAPALLLRDRTISVSALPRVTIGAGKAADPLLPVIGSKRRNAGGDAILPELMRPKKIARSHRARAGRFEITHWERADFCA